LTDDGLNAVNDIDDENNYQDGQRALKSRLNVIEREQLQKYKKIERLQEKWIESKKESKSSNDIDSEGGDNDINYDSEDSENDINYDSEDSENVINYDSEVSGKAIHCHPKNNRVHNAISNAQKTNIHQHSANFQNFPSNIL
jgi:hypothetical protein